MSPILATIISILMIFAATTAGAACVFFFKKNFSKKLSSVVNGLASGIMLSVSVFGLILPAMDGATESGPFVNFPWVPVIVGFLLGCLLLYGLDKIVPHIHQNKDEFTEGPRTNKLDKNTKFFLAVTMHNIPEGIAVGLACSLIFLTPDEALVPGLVGSALSLAIAIAIQNFPEGAAVSIPLFEDGKSKGSSFLFGFLSGVVEPIFAVIAFFLARWLGQDLMPWLLSFAGGAMVYVTVEELIPDIKGDDESHFGIWSFIIGFMFMMLMELVL